MLHQSELFKPSTAHPILLLLRKSNISSKTVPVDLGRETEYLHDLHSDDCLTVIHSINIKLHFTISLCLHVLYQWTHKLNFQLLIRPPPPALPVTQKNASEAAWSCMKQRDHGKLSIIQAISVQQHCASPQHNSSQYSKPELLGKAK